MEEESDGKLWRGKYLAEMWNSIFLKNYNKGKNPQRIIDHIPGNHVSERLKVKDWDVGMRWIERGSDNLLSFDVSFLTSTLAGNTRLFCLYVLKDLDSFCFEHLQYNSETYKITPFEGPIR